MTAKDKAFEIFRKHGVETKNDEVAEIIRKAGFSCAINSVNCYRCEWRKLNNCPKRHRRTHEEMTLHHKNRAMRPHDITLAMEDYIEEFAFVEYNGGVVELLTGLAELMDKFNHHQESEIARKIIQRYQRLEERIKGRVRRAA